MKIIGGGGGDISISALLLSGGAVKRNARQKIARVSSARHLGGKLINVKKRSLCRYFFSVTAEAWA